MNPIKDLVGCPRKLQDEEETKLINPYHSFAVPSLLLQQTVIVLVSDWLPAVINQSTDARRWRKPSHNTKLAHSNYMYTILYTNIYTYHALSVHDLARFNIIGFSLAFLSCGENVKLIEDLQILFHVGSDWSVGTKIKKNPMILCARRTSRSREQSGTKRRPHSENMPKILLVDSQNNKSIVQQKSMRCAKVCGLLCFPDADSLAG